MGSEGTVLVGASRGSAPRPSVERASSPPCPHSCGHSSVLGWDFLHMIHYQYVNRALPLFRTGNGDQLPQLRPPLLIPFYRNWVIGHCHRFLSMRTHPFSEFQRRIHLGFPYELWHFWNAGERWHYSVGAAATPKARLPGFCGASKTGGTWRHPFRC